ncbi:MAG: type IV secretory system conjugative DNA transfer family protein, partial [Emcibacter sp.]|nr:type IV secretory system conjugative DNA transfer family protein [Emcibacter sp.]
MPGTITIRDRNLPNTKRRCDTTKLMPITLGTAKWFEFPKGVRPAFEHGDLFLGKTLDGDPVGVKNDSHILACAGTRSGKGTSLIIPNIILAQGSIVVIDPKGENAIVTARERANGSNYCYGKKHKVVLLDPMGEVRTEHDPFDDLRGCFNPLDLLRDNKNEAVDCAARIADALVVSENNNESFWDDSAKDIIAAISLHVASSKDFDDDQRNLCTVRDLFHTGYHKLRAIIAANDPNGKAPSAYHLMFRAMSKNKAYDGEVAKQGLRLMMLQDQSGRTMAGAAQVAMTNLNFLASKQMRTCVSKSSFKLSELKTDPKGVSLYVCLPQRYAETHFRWLRMITTLILAEMERVKGQPCSGHSILMVLDEFASLRRMKVIENAAAQIAGAGVQMAFIVQTLAQLKDVYKDNYETFVANANIKMFFCNHDHFTREMVSKLAGETEIIKTAHNTSQSQGGSSSYARGSSHSVSNNSGTSGTSGWSTGGDAKGGMQFSGSGSISSGHSTTSGRSITDTHGTSNTTGNSAAQSFHKRYLINPD